MSEYEEEIPPEEKVKIASDFIAHAPPGEFNEVFSDVRVLLNDDQLLQDGASSAFQTYNEDQFTPAKLDGVSEQVLVTAAGRLSDGRYVDPASQQAFQFDHLRKAATDLAPAPAECDSSLRRAVEKAVRDYTGDHYPSGICSVFLKGGKIVACIEDHKFQPHNFWNGRWRSQWTLDPASGNASGVLRVQVHYYEDGNVQLQSKKEVTSPVAGADDAAIAKKLVAAMAAAEGAYQSAISENYVNMSDTTFKALRRALPITRTKIDWNKILNYKLAKEMSSK